MNSKEEKLLIELIKGNVFEESYKNIDWNKFTELCYYHRITFFIQKKINKKLASKEVLIKLQETNKKISLINMVLNKEMLSLFAEFEKKRIPFIALKGMALNNLLYPESFSRVSNDIDFLSKEENHDEIKEILEKKGYKEDEFGIWNGKPYIQHSPAMKKEINGIQCMIEPHKELFFPINCFSIELNEVWKDSQKTNQVSIPSNEDAIIIAVLSAVYQHAFHGMFEALIDVKNILSKGIDCKKLKEKIIKFNAVEPMVYFNELIKETFRTEIKGIKEMEEISDKGKLNYLRKNSLEKLVKTKGFFSFNFERVKSRFYWTKNFEQKINVFFFVLVLSSVWKIKEFLFKGKKQINLR